VYSLAGYATTQSGEHIAFSIMTNNDNLPAKKALDTIDKIVEKMVEDKK
jgi:D-alanyl-D-alanine carboxypeptidase